MKVIAKLLVLAVAASSPLVFGQADERWFKVEILIFEQPAYGSDSPEVWPAFPRQDFRSQVIRVEHSDENGSQIEDTDALSALPEPLESAPSPYPPAFTPLGSDARELTALATSMRRNRGFRILYHEAWAQPVPGRVDVIPIRIDSGERFGNQYELQGYLDIYVERFLHLRADLQLIRYTQTDNPFRLIDDDIDGISLQSFGGLSLLTADTDTSRSTLTDDGQRFYMATESVRLAELRRMRSTEIHYLDNPRIGVLAVIHPQPRLDEIDAAAE